MRDGKSLSDWLDLDYRKRPRTFRRLSKWLCWSAFGVCLLAVGLTLLPGQQQLYQAGPVTRVHALFQDRCEVCHTEAFQTALRFVDAGARAVPDAACEKCHSGHVHHTTQIRNTNCVLCHREHRGDRDLTHISEALCLDCHRDLQHGVKPGVATKFLNVPSWLEHPEFRGRKRSQQEKPGESLDPGTIRFNHFKHLRDDGVPTLDPEQVKKQWGDQGDAARTAGRKVLKCGDCHQPDGAGHFMQQISFEKHCSECHPLSVQIAQRASDADSLTALQLFAAKSAPHEAPEVVRGVLRQRLTRFIREQPRFLDDADAKPARPIPGSFRPDRPTTEKEFAWVNEQLHKIETSLFRHSGWCQYCHKTNGDKEVDGLPELLPAQINTRLFPLKENGKTRWTESAQWFPHSRFNHETHRMVECTDCHKGIRTSEATGGPPHMPTIDACRKCHTGAAIGSARTDCAECHNYHPHKW